MCGAGKCNKIFTRKPRWSVCENFLAFHLVGKAEREEGWCWFVYDAMLLVFFLKVYSKAWILRPWTCVMMWTWLWLTSDLSWTCNSISIIFDVITAQAWFCLELLNFRSDQLTSHKPRILSVFYMEYKLLSNLLTAGVHVIRYFGFSNTRHPPVLTRLQQELDDQFYDKLLRFSSVQQLCPFKMNKILK